MTEQKIHFQNLDVLRFLAASMVVFAHAFEAWYGWFGIPPLLQGTSSTEFSAWGQSFLTFNANLGLGVDVFFLISGFLITYLLLKEKEATGTISILKFYVRRGLRIWPLYFLLIGVGYLIVKDLNSSPEPNYLVNLLFLNNFEVIKTDHGVFPFTHFWSICIEEHFYFVWPLIILLVPVRKLPLAFALLIATSILFRGYVFHAGWSWQYLYLHTVSRADVMIIGGLLAYVHYIKPIVITIERPIRVIVYSIFILLLFTESYHLWNSVLSSAIKKYYYTGVILFAVTNYLFNPTAFLNFKTKTVWHYLGKISFGIYLFSNMIIPYAVQFQYKIEHTFDKSPFAHNMVVFILMNFVITIFLSIVSYELFEKFFLRLKTRFEIIKTKR